MKSIPFPLRVAAGLAVTTAERVRELPKQVTGFPVTVASQVLQASMRVQQQVTELAIKGDDVLSTLRPTPEAPAWATFDEDLPTDLPDEPAGAGERPAGASPKVPVDGLPGSSVPGSSVPGSSPGRGVPGNNGQRPDPPSEAEPAESADVEDPWDAEELALLAEEDSHEPAGIGDYDELSLPQLRARLRRFSLAELGELLDYERANADRPSFTGMLQRRIGNVRKSAEAATDSGSRSDSAGSSGAGTDSAGTNSAESDPTANAPTDDETGR